MGVRPTAAYLGGSRGNIIPIIRHRLIAARLKLIHKFFNLVVSRTVLIGDCSRWSATICFSWNTELNSRKLMGKDSPQITALLAILKISIFGHRERNVREPLTGILNRFRKPPCLLFLLPFILGIVGHLYSLQNLYLLFRHRCWRTVILFTLFIKGLECKRKLCRDLFLGVDTFFHKKPDIISPYWTLVIIVLIGAKGTNTDMPIRGQIIGWNDILSAPFVKSHICLCDRKFMHPLTIAPKHWEHIRCGFLSGSTKNAAPFRSVARISHHAIVPIANLECFHRFVLSVYCFCCCLTPCGALMARIIAYPNSYCKGVKSGIVFFFIPFDFPIYRISPCCIYRNQTYYGQPPAIPPHPLLWMYRPPSPHTPP